MTRKSLLLFLATSVIWGSSFPFIRLAVEHMPPAWVVFGRTVLDMAAPTFLTAWGEERERLTIGAVAGLVLIALGAWLATSRK